MELVIPVDGAELCVESFGARGDEPLLLIAGTSCSMDWWPAPLCEKLAARNLFVIRYDQRDTGRSSYDPPGRPSYTLPDLVTDAVGILDHVGAASAHVVGFSQGGWIAQLAAIDHPGRVRSLALLSTRPTGHGPADADLPEVSEKLLAAWSDAPDDPDWQSPEQVVAALVEGERSIAGDEFDETHARSIADNCVRRARQVQSALANHPIAEQGPRWRERLGGIDVPCQVVHGTADPMFPIGNAEALAREIPRARLERMPGVGHELPPRTWDRAIDLIEAHIRGAL